MGLISAPNQQPYPWHKSSKIEQDVATAQSGRRARITCLNVLLLLPLGHLIGDLGAIVVLKTHKRIKRIQTAQIGPKVCQNCAPLVIRYNGWKTTFFWPPFDLFLVPKTAQLPGGLGTHGASKRPPTASQWAKNTFLFACPKCCSTCTPSGPRSLFVKTISDPFWTPFGPIWAILMKQKLAKAEGHMGALRVVPRSI